jgi:lysozyme family protein
MADFKLAYFKTMGHEGGYVNNVHDRGGETYKGIARKMNPSWEGWPLIDSYKKAADFKRLMERDEFLENLVRLFYKSNYWDPIGLDQIKFQSIAEELFDTAVNMGVSIAIKFLQEALNLLNRNQKDFKDISVDGALGSKTLESFLAYPNQTAMLKTLNGLQFTRYRNICSSDPSQEVFFHGWLNRV